MKPLVCLDVQAELGRCLHRLVTLFPDPGFRAPELVIDTGYPALPETPLEPDWGKMILYPRDLVGSAEEILTILLHKAIHAYHAFLWEEDCTCWSYHTLRFRRLAEQLGLRVGWHHRYGWSQTLPTPGLFADLAPTLDLVLAGRAGRARVVVPRVWHCGQLRFPSRTDERRGECRRRSLRVHHRKGFPMIRMSGRWLWHLGFRPGCRLKVEGYDGRLLIEARPEVSS